MKHKPSERPDPALGSILVYYKGKTGDGHVCLEPAAFYEDEVGMFRYLYGRVAFWCELPSPESEGAHADDA